MVEVIETIKNDRSTWVREKWSQEADDAIGDLLEGAKDCFIEEINSGIADLWRIEYEGGFTGTMITRLDVNTLGEKELVLIAGRGNGMHLAVDDLKEGCRKSGVKSIRAHSSRPGYERLVSKMGFVKIESVYRCEV